MDLLPINTNRLTLRLLEPEEAHLMVRYVTENLDHLQPWEPIRQVDYYTVEYWKNELSRRQHEFSLREGLNLAIFFKDPANGPVVGVCNFTNFMYGVFQACFLGYSIQGRYQGQGIMFEALERAIDFVFKTFKIHRIMANYMPRNERSARVLERLGFSVEGYARDYLKIAGKWEDHVLTSKLSDTE